MGIMLEVGVNRDEIYAFSWQYIWCSAAGYKRLLTVLLAIYEAIYVAFVGKLELCYVFLQQWSEVVCQNMAAICVAKCTNPEDSSAKDDEVWDGLVIKIEFSIPICIWI